jgi:hypothetical protein
MEWTTFNGRWEDNIKMDLSEIGWGCTDWMDRER